MKRTDYWISTAVLCSTLVLTACTAPPAVKRFATPDDAAKAVLGALQTNDIEEMKAIFGENAEKDLSSGDPVADRHDRETIAIAMEESFRWDPLGDDRKELVVGDEQWPFPIPLMHVRGGWYFDTDAGRDEILSRRIGRNELRAIDLCLAYVWAQEEYAKKPRDGKLAGLYAQRFRSTPGRQDGLYFETGPEERKSPFSDLVAQAEAEGYDVNKSSSEPFAGYHFRVLTAQGPAAKGGARSYIVNGEMSGGFGLIAYPADYGRGGIMTFIVNQEGVVYQKDLGEDTLKVASAVTAYDPDDTWTEVEEPESETANGTGRPE
jgi:hypothetical protein